MNYLRAVAIVCVSLVSSLLIACATKKDREAQPLLPADYKVSVAPFTQPIDPAQLIAGQIPEDQGKVPDDELAALNGDLRRILMTETERSYIFIPGSKLPVGWNKPRSSAQPAALQRWVKYGRDLGATYLLVPQILNWNEREGSEAGVTSSAYIRMELFLINVKEGMVRSRAIFEEKQVGLVDNLLSVGDFVKRKGKWLNARELASDGMRRAVRDLGL